MMLPLAFETLALLALVAFFAGFFDAIAGGGGLITVPALLLAGVSPVEAIATNKLQGTFGVASSTFTFWRAGRIEPHIRAPLFASAFIGGIAGAGLAHYLPDAVLRAGVPILLIAIALFMLLSPKLGDADAHPRLSLRGFALGFGLGIGVYDGAFGPGAGTFYMMALIGFAGFSLMRALAHTRLMNLGSNLGGLLFFLASGHVLIPVGLAMGAASACGAYLGARAGMRFGARLVRPLVIAVSLAMAAKLLMDPTNPLHLLLAGLRGG